MRKKNPDVELLDSDGISEGQWVEREIAEYMVDTGKYRWWSNNNAVRLIPRHRPSCSSASSLGSADAEALAGVIRLSERRRERLAGWNISVRVQ